MPRPTKRLGPIALLTKAIKDQDWESAQRRALEAQAAFDDPDCFKMLQALSKHFSDLEDVINTLADGARDGQLASIDDALDMLGVPEADED